MIINTSDRKLALLYLNLLCYSVLSVSSGPQSPRSVMSFCSVIVWQAPFRAYGFITGYEVRLFNSNSNMAEDFMDGDLVGSVVISKNRDELFHEVSARDMPRGNSSVLVQVCVHYVSCMIKSQIAITCCLAWLVLNN